MTAPLCGCDRAPAAGWEEQGWCCQECALEAHMAWHTEYDEGGLR